MGLFNWISKIKKGFNDPAEDEAKRIAFEENYKQLKELFSLIKKKRSCRLNNDELKELIRECNLYIDLAYKIDRERMSKRMFYEAFPDKYTSTGFNHQVFGLLFNNEKDYVDHTIIEVKRAKNRFINLISFNNERDSIPKVDVQITDAVIHRNKMTDIPETKYASVGKSFNKDALSSFVVIDTETTGLKASSDRIIQLSAIRYIEWEPEFIWNSYINPKRKIPEEAAAINGITDEMLIDKPIIGSISKSFLEFVGNCAVVGYNLPFDLKFLFAEGLDLTDKKRKFFDVMTLAKKVYRGEKDMSFKLSAIAYHNDIDFNPHNSVDDCLATGKLFELFVDQIVE